MSLYDELKGQLHGKTKTVGFHSTGRIFEKSIEEATRQAEREGRPITGYRNLSYVYGRGRGLQESFQVPIFGQTEEERLGPVRAEQQRLAGIQQASYEKQQADIAKQLKIVQGEKSAVAKMQQDYSDMLIREAEAKKKAEEEARLALRTDRANLARAGQTGSLQIQPAGSTPRTAGTQQFRRRAVQFGGGTPYTGLSQISSGMVNV